MSFWTNFEKWNMSTNKMSGKEIKTYQYSLHPIFAPYFQFSYRRKRKLSLTDEEIRGCIECPEPTVDAILRRKKIFIDGEDIVSLQPSLFDSWQ